jgi:hypothetical protein
MKLTQNRVQWQDMKLASSGSVTAIFVLVIRCSLISHNKMYFGKENYYIN